MVLKGGLGRGGRKGQSLCLMDRNVSSAVWWRRKRQKSKMGEAEDGSVWLQRNNYQKSPG